MLLHASCVALAGHGILLMGPSGCGKSDVALQLIDRGAELVADDQVEVRPVGPALMAAVPLPIAGYFEVRHVGVLHMPYRLSVPVALCVELTPLAEELERLPEPGKFTLLDQPVPYLKLPGFAASTAAKIRTVLSHKQILRNL